MKCTRQQNGNTSTNGRRTQEQKEPYHGHSWQKKQKQLKRTASPAEEEKTQIFRGEREEKDSSINFTFIICKSL